MRTETANGWTYYFNDESKIESDEIIGKYLFFASSKKLLVSLGLEIMKKFGLPSMKVPSTNTPNDSPGFEFVLAVFDTSNHQQFDIDRFLTSDRRWKTINYRWFKTNAATNAGKYSKEYKESQAYGKSKS